VKIESLPGRVEAKLEVAAGGVQPPVERWRSLGWSVRDPETVSASLGDYRRYVEGSRGELSVAKNVYVATGSGWFSCRSVCYLAAGRPVVLQDTGFSELLDTGTGVVPFSDLDGAARALAAVERDYDEHSQAARAIAEEHFDAAVVLGELLERAGALG
jgi:glycosyltransferase involved in cell wall biosynthesis